MSAIVDQHVWEKTLARLQGRLDDESFATWLRPTQFHHSNGDTVTLSVPSPLFKSWLCSNYRDKIEGALKEITAQDLRLDFMVDAATDRAPQEIATDNGSQPPVEAPSSAMRQQELHKSNHLNPKYVFDRYVVGESNRFAHAACRQVAEPLSKSYNPLFIYGGVGLGKTHLMHAIGHQLLRTNTGAKVLYVTSEQFMNSFIESISQGKQFEFRDCYRNVDLLLIDDIQFFSGKERTQTEFFHTFNALYDAGKKIVVSSDRPPKELTTLEDRLRNRFSWGLVVDVQPPDLETRIAIVMKKALEEQVDLPSEVALYIAERVQSNIRELEGVLVRLKAYSILQRQPVTLELSKNVLAHLLENDAPRPIDIEDIIEVVCTYFDVKRTELLGSSRLKKFASPRHIAQYISRKATPLSYPEIALKFGGRDHTSILHAVKKIEDEMSHDDNLRNLVAYLTRKVRGTQTPA
ncbi:MAG: chromosomal replication initiator protein DnaA [Candidatus Sumerlaeaceae bacterium]